MNTTLDNLYKTNYNVSFINLLRQFWTDKKHYTCIGHPKQQDLFLFLDGCDAEYTLLNGTKLHATSGNIIYTPLGSQYKVKFVNFQNQNSSTIGINFLVFDDTKSHISFAQDVLVLNTNEKVQDLLLLAEKHVNSTTNNIPALLKATIFQIISELGKNQNALETKQEYGLSLIARATKIINENISEELSIENIAKQCHISSVYLRKLFKKFIGVSPTEYRLNSRLKKAKSYLRYGDISINEISQLLGFCSTAYFIKQFKNKYNITPLAYRNKHRE